MCRPSWQDSLKLTEQHYVQGKTGVSSHPQSLSSAIFSILKMCVLSSLWSLVVFVASGFSHTPDLIIAKQGMAAEPIQECATHWNFLCTWGMSRPASIFHIPCSMLLYHPIKLPQQILRHELSVSSQIRGGEESEGKLCLMLARGLCHIGEDTVVQVPIQPPFKISSIMTSWCMRLDSKFQQDQSGRSTEGLSVNMETNITTSSPLEVLHPKGVQHLDDLWLLLIQLRPCSKQRSRQLKHKFAFLNLLPCTSTVQQDFHNLESSKQIICYIIQSKRSEILALIIFSKLSGGEVQSGENYTCHKCQLQHCPLSTLTNLFIFLQSRSTFGKLGNWFPVWISSLSLEKTGSIISL